MYGALHLDSFTLAVLAVIAVITLIVTVPVYVYLSKWGMVPHFIGITATTILMVTWLTSLSSSDWEAFGVFAVIGALIAMAVSVLVPLGVAEAVEDVLP